MPLIKTLALGLGLAVLSTLATMTGFTGSAAAGLFDQLAGRWTGTGSINFASGEKEPLRCRVTYFTSEGSTRLAQNLRCASEGFIIEVKSDFKNTGGRITGSWKETTANVAGTISGRATASGLKLTITGKNFTSTMILVLNGGRQSVAISSRGGKVARIAVHLSKG